MVWAYNVLIMGPVFLAMNFTWLDEKIPKLRKSNWFYNLVCFILGKRKEKLSYKEYMMLIYEVNRRKLGEEKANETATIRAINIYQRLNGKLPEEGE